MSLAACGDDSTLSTEPVLPPLAIEGVGPIPILPGTTLHIAGAGFLPSEAAIILF